MTEIIAILALILLNGLFSMSEMALISSRKTKLKKDRQNGNKLADRVLKLIDDPNRFLSTVQIGITTIGILTGIYSGDVLADDFSSYLITCGISPAYSHIMAQSIIVVITTYLTLILGELIPKRIGMAAAERISLAAYYPMHWLSVIATPFVWILSKSTQGILALFGFRDEKTKVTEEEIKMVIQEGKEAGEVKDVEQDIVDRVFLMGDMHIGSLQTHRSEIIWLDIDSTAQDVRRIIEQDIHNVYPVAQGHIDNLIGMVSLKDIVTTINRPDFSLRKITRKPNFFYENTNVYTALESMKEKKQSHALVYDEFGSLQGIVTLRDVMENLIGHINSSPDEPIITPRTSKNEWIIDGQCPFSEFLNYFDLEELYQNYNYNTISGLILDLIGHIPAVGEQTQWQQFTFEVADMDNARIDKIIATRNSPTD